MNKLINIDDNKVEYFDCPCAFKPKITINVSISQEEIKESIVSDVPINDLIRNKIIRMIDKKYSL